MQLGVHIVSFDYPEGPDSIGPTLSRAAAVADSVGVSTLSVMDHYFQIPVVGPPERAMLEGYTTLGYLAARTEHVQLGLLVTGVSYRHPGLLAKIVSTLDVLSGGRAELGIGAAWFQEEHRGLGVPFPPLAERFERLEEALQICLQMWDPSNNGKFIGRHYQLDQTLCSPAPITRPHPPILIGGSGERKTLRLVARYGDACNLFAAQPGEVRHKLDVLQRHCEAVGRDYSDIRKTILHIGDALARGEIDRFVEEMADYRQLGVQEVIVTPLSDRPDAWIEEVCGPAAQRLTELG